ncbi:unnamed protein product [Polarella glacialis]|uniref:Uncharacterized protein n=1 Tax=Polarella glacialis TaxID=89957 RepID=A0A813K192_POLGL|nr:unnamed protein product [Polarella glacialis]
MQRSMNDFINEEIGSVRWLKDNGNLCYTTSNARSYEYSALRCGASVLTSLPSFDFEAAWRGSLSSECSATLEEWLVQRILSPAFSEVSYSRFPYIFGEESSARAAMDSFKGNCVAFAEYLVRKLQEELGLPDDLGPDEQETIKVAFIIPSTLPEAYHQAGYPHWGHAAVAIPLEHQGCIILDPAIRLHLPVVLREDGDEHAFDWADGPPAKGLPKVSSIRWRFVLDANAGKVHAFSPQQPDVVNFIYSHATVLSRALTALFMVSNSYVPIKSKKI